MPPLNFLRRAWFGEFSLGFTFFFLGCLAPAPIFVAKFYLRDAGVFTHEDPLVFLAGQLFLWLEWAYFAFITVALWNASANHRRRAERGESGGAAWGWAGQLLAVASGILALGSFANLSGLTALIFGGPLFIGLGGG